ncbi:protein phosphatase 1 regulatory (inhibitor) subunit 2 [Anaeramoeba ignava]|uniref:Protein phosphatase 1 regulatory (Inhibitor) subunit 2 n=1 Tax=Anaeramoeba ignava TaxID=1746090 RepID=A0A9Q0RGA9_ANAIG|nr:protein phosphatase 1 regulatory (inhibitor) subunit 2 [Anaeramoeba ignava]
MENNMENNVHGILKEKNDQQKMQKNTSLRWDEENLRYNEENRTDTMIIDEPKTPYNYEQFNDSSSDSEDFDQKKNQINSNQISLDQLSETLFNSKTLNETILEDQQNKEKEFNEKRAQHYNEYFELQKYLKEQEKEENQK